jgi:hypothetical protein
MFKFNAQAEFSLFRLCRPLKKCLGNSVGGAAEGVWLIWSRRPDCHQSRGWRWSYCRRYISLDRLKNAEYQIAVLRHCLKPSLFLATKTAEKKPKLTLI